MKREPVCSTVVTIDRENWLRIKADGTGGPVKLFNGGDEKCCVMGFVLRDIYDVDKTLLEKVEYPSEVGISKFTNTIASPSFGNTTTLEREIAAVSDRKGLYASYSDEQVESVLVGLMATAGFIVEFQN